MQRICVHRFLIWLTGTPLGVYRDAYKVHMCVCVCEGRLCALLPLRFNFVQVKWVMEGVENKNAAIQLCAACLNFLVYSFPAVILTVFFFFRFFAVSLLTII